MHILATTTASLDDLIEPVDLRQAPADMVALSFTDSDLAGLASAWRAERNALPGLRLAALRDLRHPMSVDLWVDSVAAHARVIVVRVLGGYDWWRYGCDRLSEAARQNDTALALLPGEGQADDERLALRSTVDADERAALLAYFRQGGPDNMRALARRMAQLSGSAIEAADPTPLPKAGVYAPGHGIVSADSFKNADPKRPVVPILFYRSMLLASDVAPIDALCEALTEQDISAVPVFVSSLRDGEAVSFVQDMAERLQPSALIAATAFSSGAEPGEKTLFDWLGVPVFQVVTATTRRKAWQEGQRGLAPADLAMHVVLPELDGRIMAGAISFKDEAEIEDGLAFGLHRNRPEEDRIAQVARRIAAQLALQAKPCSERRIIILIPDYPSAPGRTGYAVGLDVPASVLAVLQDLGEAGYMVENIPETSRDLMRMLDNVSDGVQLAEYRQFLSRLSGIARKVLEDTWGDAESDAENGGFRFRAAHFGNVTVALAPDRGRAANRRIDYHDPTLPPRHALVAFGQWMCEKLKADALVHVGAHGTLEWLPGKTVALTENCFPEIVTGALPIVYPFIVSNPGEAAQAKRRIGAVTLGHLTPPLIGAGLSDEQRELERLVDEYAQADGLDRRRRDRLAKLIVETAERTGLATEAGVQDAGETDMALMQIDAWLCDLKDFAIKDGLHIYGRGSAADDTPERAACAEAERTALLAALDGRHVPPGPSGAPSRGRTDVLPTGRNLFTADPRTLPTPTAMALGRKAADEAVRSYLQQHGDWPKSLVIDLWGSASLRTGGEEVAQGLALMGCRPQWDDATGRVTGIEVLPPASLGRPRIDVTWRISGLFRDMFPTQIALMDAAAAAVAARAEEGDENPLAAAAQTAGKVPSRIFGSAPGTYGSGIEERLSSGDWQDLAELGRAYLDAASFSFGGAAGDGCEAEGAFATRVAEADMLLHTGDDAGRDILEGSADVAFIGGFSAAVSALGGKADLVVLDTTNPERPRARSLAQAIARTVRARALNPRFIDGQMRHGPRGAAELTETVDRLIGFAETTGAVTSTLIDAVFDAYLGDEKVRAFLLHENPAAAQAMADRFSSARRRGLWHPRRNSVDDDLAALIAEAEAAA